MLASARLFLCALCRQQVVLCRRCDRGQHYCSKTCSGIRRTQQQREANIRYANSLKGRHNNAQRQRRYQARQRNQNPPIQEIVTDQGSAPDALPDKFVRAQSGLINKPDNQQPIDMRCHFCSVSGR
jgi:hypothetical protein